MLLIVSATREELGDLPGQPLGLGAVVAAARMGALVERERPDAVVMLGTGGAYPRGGPALGSAIAGRRFGLSAGVAALGLGYVPHPPAPIEADAGLLGLLHLPQVDVLTVQAITTDADLADRLSDGWQMEHMETYGAAWACARSGVPFVAVLGVTSLVGPDAHTQWLLHRHEAQARAREAVASARGAERGAGGVNWRDQRIIAFDTETTGLNPHDGDRIIEFAAVEIKVGDDGRVLSTRPHQLLFNPGIPIPRKVVEITGIDDDAVADAPAFEEGARRVRRVLHGAVAVAHNFAFDRNFLTAEFARNGLTWPECTAEIDTVDLSIRLFPDARGHKLEKVAQRLEVTLDRAHRATDDAEACGRCFVEMARRFDAPAELEGLLEWADALGRPPETRYFERGDRLRFAAGPFSGEPVEEHPLHLQWMLAAQERRAGGWRYRFPESLRRWATRFLKVRASGRARQNPKSFGPEDWVIDSNALPLPSVEGASGRIASAALVDAVIGG